MRKVTRCAVLSAVLVAALSGATATASGTAVVHPAERGPTVLGYIESGDGLAPLRRNLPALTSAGVDGLNISARGTSVSAPDGASAALLTAAHRAAKPAQLLVGNYSSAINDFDPDAAHRLFSSPSNRRAVVAALVADARRGWDGVALDFESLRGSDRAGLTRFTSELRAALPPATTLGMAVMASTTAQGYRDDGYDLTALAPLLDQVVLMAYDQHGPTWTAAGPIGGLPWARQAMSVMLRAVPASKAVLGIAGYGYTWPTHGVGTQLGDEAARRSAVHPEWDARQGEWHAQLHGGGTLWWSDARSIKVRERLASSLHCQGVAVWSLGLSDTLTR